MTDNKKYPYNDVNILVLNLIIVVVICIIGLILVTIRLNNIDTPQKAYLIDENTNEIICHYNPIRDSEGKVMISTCDCPDGHKYSVIHEGIRCI